MSDDNAEVVEHAQQLALLGGVGDGFVFVALFADSLKSIAVKQVFFFR